MLVSALLEAQSRPTHLLTEDETFLTHRHSLPALRSSSCGGCGEMEGGGIQGDETEDSVRLRGTGVQTERDSGGKQHGYEVRD